MCYECDLYVNGHCTKYGKNRACKPSTKDWLDDGSDYEDREFISVDQMCRKSSIFGNDYVGITQNDIDRLKNGEVIHISGEYGIFIGFIDKQTISSDHETIQPKPRVSTIPNLLAVLRALNINLDRLSMYTGISKKTLISYVEGEVTPRKATIGKIAKALNVSTDDLMRRDYIGTEMAMLSAIENAAKKRKAGAEILADHFERFIKEKFGCDDEEDM